ncbi:hypothetical protein ZIOFF_040637 [Zingiber officinale]|uniref:Uncharacterized protein n=1 Tax=Zingiber officinale TaxID=94328 RepID=A0A8J5GCS3_ZINOF|nr:hypothetical protein ZIOFF_040637 [Zingiber officinale]
MMGAKPPSSILRYVPAMGLVWNEPPLIYASFRAVSCYHQDVVAAVKKSAAQIEEHAINLAEWYHNDNIAAYDQELKSETTTITSGAYLHSSHVPQHLPSLEEDPYLPYPDLFSSNSFIPSYD